jgi:DnaJ-class molecular chaperone
MLGKEIVLDSIDGRELNVTIPAGSQPNGVLRLTGYGMPNVNDPRFKGNLMLNLEITIPKNLTESQKDLIKQIMN